MPRWLNIKVVIFLVFLVGAYFIYQKFMGGPGGADMEGMAAPVSVAEVITREVRQWHEFSGRLVAVDSAEVRPRVSGVIEQVHFQEGQWVVAGAPLFTIDPKPYLIALQSAHARAVWADKEFKRAQQLVSNKVVSRSDFDERRNNAEVARADYERAKLEYEYTVVKAPVAGHVSRAEVTMGNLVDAGGNAPVLTRVISNRPIYADFEIDEQSFITYLHAVGSDTEKLRNVPINLGLTGDDGMPYSGHVLSFDNQLDPRSGTIRVRAIVENPEGKLIPGLFARVSLGEPEMRQAILITDRAVGTDQHKKFVFVVAGEENMVEYRQVQLGALVEGMRVVNDGLKPGEKIIVNGLMRARPGAPVKPEMVAMDAPEKGPGAGEQGPAAGEQGSDNTNAQH